MFPIILIACSTVIFICTAYLWYRDIKETIVPRR